MFGRRTKERSDDEQERAVDVDVDLILERDISGVQQAVDNYLQGLTENLRQALLSTLEALDEQLALCDAYRARVRMATIEPKVVGAPGQPFPGIRLPVRVPIDRKRLGQAPARFC
jgi:hypothetical protein